MGDRVTLAQSVLFSILIYHLSFYLLPKNILHELVKIQRAFLWGGNANNSKISWVSWGDICKPKNEGGLGIRDLEIFIRALVGKWIGRLLGESEGLWVRVVLSKYGRLEKAGRMMGNYKEWSNCSIWWRDICKLYWGLNGNGMKSDFIRILGRGEGTWFCNDIWVCEENLKAKFPRLF